jgi:hypothetical protein
VPQAVSLIFSIVIEAIVAFAWLRAFGWGNGWRGALSATVGTLITHPIVWRTVPPLEEAIGYGAAVALIEAGVVLAESIPYRLIVPLAWKRALAVSLVANAASACAGIAVNALAG